MKKYIVCLFLILLIILFSGCGILKGIENSNSYLIYDGNDPPSEKDLSRAVNIEILNVDSLDFLEELDRLKSIKACYEFSRTVSGDISSLSGLHNLEDVFLYNTEVFGSIDSLNKLSNLQYLNLEYSQVEGNLKSLDGIGSLSDVRVKKYKCVRREFRPGL